MSTLSILIHPTYQPPLGLTSNSCHFCIFAFCRLSLLCTPLLSSCQIDWHKGKDVTVKTIKKKQKHKGRGTVRTVTKQVPNDSFFNFFNPVKGEIGEKQTHISKCKIQSKYCCFFKQARESLSCLLDSQQVHVHLKAVRALWFRAALSCPRQQVAPES